MKLELVEVLLKGLDCFGIDLLLQLLDSLLALIAHQLNVLHVLVVCEPELREALDDVGKLVQLVVQALDLRQKEGLLRELNRHLVALIGVRYEGLLLRRFLGIVSLKSRLLTIGIL